MGNLGTLQNRHRLFLVNFVSPKHPLTIIIPILTLLITQISNKTHIMITSYLDGLGISYL